MLAPDQFGYLSVHKVARVSKARARLPEWVDLRDLFVEIQIRTVVQHSWAAISHALQYKNEAEIPAQFQRKLMRISGLLELADEEFAALRAQQAILRKDIEEKVSEGNLDIPIDALSVSEFFLRSKVADDFAQAATDAGFIVGEGFGGELGVSQLIQACQKFGITTVKDLKAALTLAKPSARKFFEAFMKEKGDRKPAGSIPHIAAMVLVGMAAATASEEEIKNLAIPWSDSYTSEVFEAGKKTAQLRSSGTIPLRF
jgi:hypothetical protein